MTTSRATRRIALVEQKLLIILGHTSSPANFSGVHVTRSLVLCVCFVYRCLSFGPFSFGHCVVCSSLIYEPDYPFVIFKLFSVTKMEYCVYI